MDLILWLFPDPILVPVWSLLTAGLVTVGTVGWWVTERRLG